MEFTVTPPSSLRFKLTNAIARKNSSEFGRRRARRRLAGRRSQPPGRGGEARRAAFLEPENRASSPALEAQRTEPRTGTLERSPLSDDVRSESMVRELTLGERLTADAGVPLGRLDRRPRARPMPRPRRRADSRARRRAAHPGRGQHLLRRRRPLAHGRARAPGAECLITRAGGRLVACPCARRHGGAAVGRGRSRGRGARAHRRAHRPRRPRSAFPERARRHAAVARRPRGAPRDRAPERAGRRAIRTARRCEPAEGPASRGWSLSKSCSCSATRRAAARV